MNAPMRLILTSDYTTTLDQACVALNLHPGAIIELVRRGLLDVHLPDLRRGATLADARFLDSRVQALRGAGEETQRARIARPPYNTPDYERACALGALLEYLGR